MFVQLTKDFQGQKAGTRIDVTEADAKTLLDAGLAARLEGDQLAPLIAKSMEGMLASISETIAEERTVEIRNGHDLITWTPVPGPNFAKEFAEDLNKVFKQIREAAHEGGEARRVRLSAGRDSMSEIVTSSPGESLAKAAEIQSVTKRTVPSGRFCLRGKQA
jgi:hypothetical protein